jgi:hypothetical protein
MHSVFARQSHGNTAAPALEKILGSRLKPTLYSSDNAHNTGVKRAFYNGQVGYPEPEKAVLNQYLETTNLGVRSSNLFGRARFLILHSSH